MPYEVISEGVVSILKAVGEFRAQDGTAIGYDHESVPRMPGEVIPDNEISPVVIKAYEDGDAHVRSILVKVDAKGKRTDKTPDKQEPEEKVAPVSQNLTEEGVVRAETGKSQMAGAAKAAPAPAAEG